MAPRARIPDVGYSKKDAVEGAAWGYLIQAINYATPDVFASLKENVLPVWLSDNKRVIETDGDPAEPAYSSRASDFARNALLSWARSHNLDFPILIDVTELTLDQFLESRPIVIEKPSDWKWFGGFHESTWEWNFRYGSREIVFWPPSLTLTWNPQGKGCGSDELELNVGGTRQEARRAFIEAMDRYFDLVETLAEQSGLTPTPEKRSDKGHILDHFDWLAIKLIRQETWYGLKKTTGKSIQTIKGGVRSACELTGIPVERVGLTPK